MTDVAPFVKLLVMMATMIRIPDYSVAAGLLGPADDAGARQPLTLTVRHARNRRPVKSEKPCVTIVFVSDEPRDDAEQQHNDWERWRELVVDLQLDMDLDTEDSEIDPTGFGKLTQVHAAVYAALSDADGRIYLGGLCDDLSPGSFDPDEKSTSDDGRLVRGITVLYRVRSDDPNVLLSAGENG